MQRAGYRKETRKVSAEDESSCVRVWSNVCTAPRNLRSGHKKKDAPCRKGTDQHVMIRSKIYLRATVQDGVSRIHPQLLFFAAKVQIWPLLSIHTLKSAMSAMYNLCV